MAISIDFNSEIYYWVLLLGLEPTDSFHSISAGLEPSVGGEGGEQEGGEEEGGKEGGNKTQQLNEL